MNDVLTLAIYVFLFSVGLAAVQAVAERRHAARRVRRVAGLSTHSAQRVVVRGAPLDQPAARYSAARRAGVDELQIEDFAVFAEACRRPEVLDEQQVRR